MDRIVLAELTMIFGSGHCEGEERVSDCDLEEGMFCAWNAGSPLPILFMAPLVSSLTGFLSSAMSRSFYGVYPANGAVRSRNWSGTRMSCERSWSGVR